ncbi:MAG TPA: S24 family peptidase [Allosphingosinicella sp.]|jgi:phage repressor protein C with HTH and peptisase S24 domain
MAEFDQRAALERLIRERGEDYSALSRLIGRNAAYIQQFIKRGVPRKLDEEDRETLARYFGVSEKVLGGRADGGLDGLVRVPRLNVGASAGHGALNEWEGETSHIAFDPRWLRQICRGKPETLSFIKVQGDSMVPSLADGDDILVDQGDGIDRLRDGVYVLRQDETLMVKRLAVNPIAKKVTIRSDNPAYPSWPDCAFETLDVIGRVVWAGRRVS